MLLRTSDSIANALVVLALVGALVYMVVHLRNLFAKEEGEEVADDTENNGGSK